MRRLSLAAAIVVLGALVFTATAQACSCAPMAPAEAMRRADAAIVGSLVEVVPRSRARADYRYRVRRVYRGAGMIERGDLIAVRSADDSAACGLPKRIDRDYGLLLDAPSTARHGDAEGEIDGGHWTGGLCGVIAPRKLRSAVGQAPGEARASPGPGSGLDCAS